MPEWGRASFTFLITIMSLGLALQSGVSQTAAPNSRFPQANLVGRWQVEFDLDRVKKNLIFESKAGGSGSFLLMGTGSHEKRIVASLPAVWSGIGNDRVSFSGEAELPLGTCCVEVGTVIFKGSFESINAISGKVVFITSVDDEESPLKLRSAVGTFTATRIVDRREGSKSKPSDVQK
jgi:hypothetical protein